MQINKFGILIFLLFVSTLTYGQYLDTVLVLDEVHITAKKEKYLVGSKIETIDSIRLSSVSGESLTEMLSQYMPVYIKQNAGGLATIRFRGTSPDHTAILFNGININSLTLGHSNLSNIPMFLFDEVKVQYGSSSALYGTDAIGGSIHMNNNPKWNKGFNIGLQQDFASFSSYFSGLKLNYSNNRINYSIKLYHKKNKNNFPFLNIAAKDFEKDEFINDEQKNAALTNWGLLQELYLKVSEKTFYYLKAWYEDSWHQIQPNMSSNYYGGSFKEIQNNNLRLISGFKYYSGIHKLTADVGYLYDYQLYDRDVIATNSYLINVNYFNSELFKGDLNAGVNLKLIKPDVYAYKNNNSETRVDLFTSYKRKLIPRVVMAINLRESIVLDYNNQFAPSLGLDYLLVKSLNHTLNCKASVSKSYKIPTFNNRFWNPGGNPDLKPETGMNYEFNTKYKITHNKNKYHIAITGFIMNVDDWIQWVNDNGIWTPKNVKMVQSKGVEFNFRNTVQISNLKLNSGINYSYNKVEEIQSYNKQSNSIGKQLIYTPKHTGNAHIALDYRKWKFSASASYTGLRYIDNINTIDGYFLLNTSLGKNFYLRKHTVSVDFKVKNILNKAYQNQELYAMPGINYALSIKYNITNLKFKKNENN